jgi:hypothetical protein
MRIRSFSVIFRAGWKFEILRGRFPVIVRYYVHPERLPSEPGTRPAKYQKSISRLQNSDCAEYLFCAKLY